MARKWRRWRDPSRPPISFRQILAWADAHHRRTGRWPNANLGLIPNTPEDETWVAVDAALKHGYRGLPGGVSLAQLLLHERGVPIGKGPPPLRTMQILAWADAHRARTRRWPVRLSGPIFDSHGETWLCVDAALRGGIRGLRGGTTLAQFLLHHRGVALGKHPPPLTKKQILAWADEHHRRTGQWPSVRAGALRGAAGETWLALASALYQGSRGLPGGSSLARLLTQYRGVRNVNRPPQLTQQQILRWADAHYRRHGRWPTLKSGPIPGTNGETWAKVGSSSMQGLRGLRARFSLAQLLEAERGVPNRKNLPPIRIGQILDWADAYRRRTGRWPRRDAPAVSGIPPVPWRNLDAYLSLSIRGLPGGSSLAQLLSRRRGVPNVNYPPRLTIHQILVWAGAHRRRTGQRPRIRSGPISEAPRETWAKVNGALQKGRRGLPGGSSLRRLLERQRKRSGR